MLIQWSNIQRRVPWRHPYVKQQQYCWTLLQIKAITIKWPQRATEIEMREEKREMYKKRWRENQQCSQEREKAVALIRRNNMGTLLMK